MYPSDTLSHQKPGRPHICIVHVAVILASAGVLDAHEKRAAAPPPPSADYHYYYRCHTADYHYYSVLLVIPTYSFACFFCDCHCLYDDVLPLTSYAINAT